MIAAENIRLTRNKKTILSVPFFCLQEFECCGILGPNGAGKSTFLKVLSGATLPDEGEIFLKNKPLKHWNQTILAQQRSVVEQHQNLLGNLTVQEVLLLGRFPYSKESPMEQKAMIQATINQFDLDHLKHRPMVSLSGGEQQRVHFARAILQLDDQANPSKKGILFLDEPLNNLDIRHQIQLLQLAKTFTRQKKGSVFMVIHDINLAAQFCDRIVLMKDGSIFKDGKTEDVLNESNLFETYHTPISIKLGMDGSTYYQPHHHQLESMNFTENRTHGNNHIA